MEGKTRVEMDIGPITGPVGNMAWFLVSGGSSPDFLHAVDSLCLPASHCILGRIPMSRLILRLDP